MKQRDQIAQDSITVSSLLDMCGWSLLLPVETFGKFTTFKTNIVTSQFNKTSVYSFGEGGLLLVITVLQVAQTFISQMQRIQKWQ